MGLRLTGMVVSLPLKEAAAAILEQAISEKGIEKDTLLSDEIAKIGKDVLARGGAGA